jgi:glucokinase
MVHILFDIGGTKMRVARKVSDTEFSAPLKQETPQNLDEGLRTLFSLVESVAQGERVEGMCGGVAAVFDGTKIVNSSNLKGWIGADLGRIGEERGVAIRVVNDAALVGLGEAVFGAGAGKEVVAYITVSTGIGGARIVRGKIDENAFGFEPGHQYLDLNNLKTLEDFVSGKSMESRYGKKPREIHDLDAWEEAARTLAVGLHNTILHWSPDVLVLGGPMMVGDPSVPIEVVIRRLGELANIFTKLPEMKLANLKDDGGLYGALAYSVK